MGIVNFMQNTLKMRYLYNAYLKSGYYFLIVWFLFIQFAVRNKAAPFFLRFHSSQAILISMLGSASAGLLCGVEPMGVWLGGTDFHVPQHGGNLLIHSWLGDVVLLECVDEAYYDDAI